MDKRETFGIFIKEKRLGTNPKMTLKAMSEELEINLTLLSDIESGRKNPFSADKIERFCEILKLSDEEKAHMYDLAARDIDAVPEDISEEIMYTEYGDIARKALRMTRDGQIDEDEWKNFIRRMENKK